MFIIRYYCHYSGKVFEDHIEGLDAAQKEWDRLEFKRSIYMHTKRPA